MNFSIAINTKEGDEYRITLESRKLPEDLKLLMRGKELVEIILERTKGQNITGFNVLNAISDAIYRFLIDNNDVILYFYCDDLHEIPQTLKTIPPQEYRSKLFSLMFVRYAELNDIKGITDTPINIKTVAEDAYIHLISHDSDLPIVDDLKDDILYHYSK